MKKYSAAILLALIIIGATPLLPERRAHAIFGFEAETAAAYTIALQITQEVLKKRFFDMIVDQIVFWIQGGGQPLFISDWNVFLAQYGNIVTGDIIGQLGLGAVCRPFGFQLQLAVMQPPRFTNQISCTLDQVVGNMVNFYNNFRAGGFIAYREMWQPRNNFYGALMLAMNEKEVRISDRRYAAAQEAQAGQGFLGTRKCDAAGHCVIVTPGTSIGAAAAKVMGADIDYIVNAQSLAAYVAAIADALINRIIREGVQGLQGVVAINAPPIGYVPNRQPNARPCAGLSGEVFASCQASIGIEIGNLALVRASYLQGLDATLAPLTDAQQKLLALHTAQQVLVSRLSELNTCQISRNISGKEATAMELAVEQKILDEMNAAIVNLQLITVPLTNAKINIASPVATDITAIQTLMTPIYPLLSQARAEEYQKLITAHRDTLTAKSTKRLPEIQVSLNQCVNS